MIAGRRMRVAIGALWVGLSLIAAPVAAADPAVPADPVPAPAPVVPAPAPAPAADLAPVTDAALAPAAPVSNAAAAPAADPAAAVTPPDGVQHLPSPSSLPPGTTQEVPDHPKAGLLRDIWYALRNGDMSGPDALKLLATRPLNPEQLAGSKPSNQSGPAAPAPADAPAPEAAAAITPVPVPAP